MEAVHLTDRFCNLNRQHQQKIDLLASLCAGSFVFRSGREVKRSIARRRRNRIAQASRRINRNCK